jgi:hypothetical protein
MPLPPRLKKLAKLAIPAGIAAGIAMQLVPIKGIGHNPAARCALGAPPEVEAIMRRACLDCHSNETRWPLYARLAPGSWLMARDVTKGRSHLNFSEWTEVEEDERETDRENAWEKVEAGEMPPWFYVYPMHLNARLSDADKAVLKSWFLKHKGKAKE